MDTHTREFKAHVRGFCELLIHLRSALGNDLDMVLILAVIAERQYSARQQTGEPGQSGDDPARQTYPTGINALSVAEYTGIPRETARRKIALLISNGWVLRDPCGILSPTPKAAVDLAHSTAATLRYLSVIAQLDLQGGQPG